jgi:hypothetical protein
MATEYQIKSLQECATQAAQGQDLSDECETALAAMPSSPPQDLNGEFTVGDMVAWGLLIAFIAPVLIAVVGGLVSGLVEQLLVRLKLKRPRPSSFIEMMKAREAARQARAPSSD